MTRHASRVTRTAAGASTSGQGVDPGGEGLCAGFVDLVAHQRGHLIVVAPMRHEPHEALLVGAGRDAQRVGKFLGDGCCRGQLVDGGQVRVRQGRVDRRCRSAS